MPGAYWSAMKSVLAGENNRMQVNDQIMLSMMQQSDSFFPSGTVPFSYGLESLVQDEIVTHQEHLKKFLLRQLIYRWASLDRGVLSATYDAGTDFKRIEIIDCLLEAMTIPKELREGSRQAGKALLSVHKRLGTQKVIAYSDRIYHKNIPGHLTIIQTLAWSDTGLSKQQCCVMSAHTLCTGIMGAAIRLGIIGHIAAQQILVSVRPQLGKVLKSEFPQLNEISAFTPISEIASMRHEVQPSRLFAN